MSASLAQFNKLSARQAEGELLKCCGSQNWAHAMSASRPFLRVAELLEAADKVWWSLGEEDWLEAFRAHPKIGEKKAAAAQTEQTQTWSAQEQIGTQEASGGWKLVGKGTTNSDGRISDLVPKEATLNAGVYRLIFDTAKYFAARNTDAFYPQVTIVFKIHDPAEHYHVPLLLNPFGYSTYRGS